VAEAVTLLNEVIKTAPNHLPARLLLGEAQERLGNRTAAIEQFGFALNLDPGSNRIALRLARLSQMQGDFTAAAQYVDRVIKSKSITVEERREAAALLANQGDSERALGLLRESYAKSGDVPADLMLAALYRERNQVKEAEAVYRACLKSPDASAIQEAAGFFASQDRKDEADRVLAMLDGIKLPPGKKEAVRGEHLLRYGDPQQAIGQFEAAVRAAPADASAWQRLVVTGLVVGKTAEAIDAAGRAIKALPEPDAGPFKTLKQNEQLVSELASTESARLVLPGLVQGPEQSSAAAETLQVIAAAKRNKAGASQFAAELEKVEVRHPNYLPLQILLAQTYMTDQRTGDAAALATRLMQIFPKAVEPAKLAVQALAASGHWNDALDTAKQWRERSLAQPIEADQMIAMAQLAIGQPARAIEQLKPYLTRATADPDANRQLLALYAQARIAAGQPEEAANLLKPLLAKSVQWRDLWVQLAAQAIKDPKLSAAWLNEVSSIPGQKSAEDDILLAGGWFVISTRTKSPEYAQSARAALETASRTASQEKNLPARRLLALGMLQEGSGNAAAAEATYRRAIQADPNVPEALNNLAMVIVNGNGDLAEAQSFAEKAVKLNPKAAAYQDTLATVHAKRKDFPKAIATMQNAVQLEPGNVKWRIYLGTVLLDAGQPDKAKAVLKEVEATHPEVERLSESARKRLEMLRARVRVDQARSEADRKASISRIN
jgi:cellulose synthase operon protein C